MKHIIQLTPQTRKFQWTIQTILEILQILKSLILTAQFITQQLITQQFITQLIPSPHPLPRNLLIKLHILTNQQRRVLNQKRKAAIQNLKRKAAMQNLKRKAAILNLKRNLKKIIKSQSQNTTQDARKLDIITSPLKFIIKKWRNVKFLTLHLKSYRVIQEVWKRIVSWKELTGNVLDL